MADEKRFAFMDASGNILECSMCKPEFAANWAAICGYSDFEDMDRPDGKVKYVEVGDQFNKVAGSVRKKAGLAAVEAFLATKAVEGKV